MSENYLYGSEDEKVLYRVLPLIKSCQTYTDGWNLFRSIFDAAYVKHGHLGANQIRDKLLNLRILPSEYYQGNIHPVQNNKCLQMAVDNTLMVVRGEIDLDDCLSSVGVSFKLTPTETFDGNAQECLSSLADYMYAAGARRAGGRVFSAENPKAFKYTKHDLPPNLSIVYRNETEIKVETICVMSVETEKKLMKFLPNLSVWRK